MDFVEDCVVNGVGIDIGRTLIFFICLDLMSLNLL